jgi:hypothetical protein
MSLSAMTTAIVLFNLGFATVAWTVLTDPMKPLTVVTTPRAGPISSVVGTTRVFLDSCIVLVLLTVPMVVTKKIAVSFLLFNFFNTPLC